MRDHDDATIDDSALPEGQQAGLRHPEQVGPFRILQVLGEGGMGTVYEAQQTQPVRRRIALKVIKLGMDTKEVVARFEAERQALAVLDHPGIARVLDAGATTDGRPYFVMELVKGVPLNRYCDENRLTLRQRLELFVSICRAVQHAHQKGIIHRDLKPSNVLVTLQEGRPVPKVIDFGLAKATGGHLTEKTLYTQLGQIIGTPAYMSPEQAEVSGLDVDTRSDIYSLGVMLYELLTGTTPLDLERLRNASLDEIRRLLREEDPQTPSKRISSLSGSGGAREIATPRALSFIKGDLDWITMKALAKDRTRRYDSADAFAADLERHLHDEPVLARPPSTAYRLSRFAKRHRGAVTAAALALVLLLAGIAGTTAGLVSAVRANGALDAALEEATRQGDIARAVNAFLREDLLSAVAPSNEAGRGREVSMLEVLDAAGRRIDEASRPGGRFGEVPLVEASIRLTLCDTYRQLGSFEQAERHGRRALELRRRQLGEQRAETAEALLALASIANDRSLNEEAIGLRREAVSALTADLGALHADTLEARGKLVESLKFAGRLDEATPMAEEVLALQREQLGPDDRASLRSMWRLGICYSAAHRFEDAESILTDLLRRRERLFGPDDPETIAAVMNLGVVAGDAGDQRKAADAWREGFERRRRVFGEDAPQTIEVRRALASTLRDLGKLDEAAGHYDALEEACLRVFGPEHKETLLVQGGRSVLLHRMGRGEEARSLGLVVFQARRRLWGLLSGETLQPLTRVVAWQLEAGGPEQVRTLAEEVASAEPSTPAEAYGQAWFLLSGLPEELRDVKAGLRAATRACEGTDHANPTYLDWLAYALFLDGRPAEAAEVQRRALRFAPEVNRAEFEEELRRYEGALGATGD